MPVEPATLMSMAADLKTVGALIGTTGVIVWRIAVIQGMVSAQNGRLADLEKGVVYKDTCDAMRAQTSQAIERIEAQFDKMDGKQEEIMHLMNRFYHHTHPPAASGDGPTQLHGG